MGWKERPEELVQARVILLTNLRDGLQMRRWVEEQAQESKGTAGEFNRHAGELSGTAGESKGTGGELKQ